MSTRMFENLFLCCLTPEQHARTCGYWYTVTDRGSTPHTAFRTRAALLDWLELRNLRLPSALPEDQGTHQVQRIEGRYGKRMHGLAADLPREGIPVLVLENAQYQTGVITRDQDGTTTVHYTHVCGATFHWDHKWAGGRIDAGNSRLPGWVPEENPYFKTTAQLLA